MAYTKYGGKNVQPVYEFDQEKMDRINARLSGIAPLEVAGDTVVDEERETLTEVRGRVNPIEEARGPVKEGDIDPRWLDTSGEIDPTMGDKLVSDLNPKRGLMGEGAFNVEEAYQATQPNAGTTSSKAAPFGTGVKAAYTADTQEEFSQPIVSMLNSESSVEYAERINPETGLKNVEEVATRVKREPITFGEAIDTVKAWAPIQEKVFNEKFADVMRLMNPNDRAEMQRFMATHPGIRAETFSQLAYSKLAPADQLMRQESGTGLAATMQLAYMYDTYLRQRAAFHAKEDIVFPVEDKKKLSKEQLRQIHQLENSAFFNEFNPDGTSAGALIAQAGDLETDGNENAMLGKMADMTVPESLSNLFTIEHMADLNGNIVTKKILTREGMDWVGSNMDLFTHALKLKHKMPRPHKKSKPDKKPDVRMKGKTALDIFTSKEAEALVASDLLLLDNTPNTVLTTQTILFSLLMGVDGDTIIPNAVTKEFDHAEYKDILHNRAKFITKPDLDGNMVQERYRGDEEKDIKASINLREAVSLIGQQYYLDHFLASNWRPHVESTVLNYQSDHLSRSLLGFGVWVPYNLNLKDDMLLLKAGIMKRSGLKDRDGLKFEAKDFATGKQAFDNNIQEWVDKFGDLIEVVASWDNLSPEQRVDLTNSFKEINNPFASQAQALVKYGQEHDGYATISSVVEAVKLRLAEQNKNHKYYSSNFLAEVDGLTNGMAQNAMWVGAVKLAAASGVTQFLVDSQGRKGNLLTVDDMYVNHANVTYSRIHTNNDPKIKALAGILKQYGLVGRGSSKGPIMIAGYSAGEALIKEGATEVIRAMISSDPAFVKELRSIGVTPAQAVKTLEDASVFAVTSTIGALQDYSSLLSSFVDEMIKQKQENESLPPPSVVFPEGIRQEFGLMVPSATGPEMITPDGEPFRRVRNEMVYDAIEIDKNTGEYKKGMKALSQVTPKTTQYGDALMVRHSARRSAEEGVGNKYAPKGEEYGNIFQHVFDGFFMPPSLMREADVILNEEFLNLGKRASNLRSLINTAKNAGYNMKTITMQNLVERMNTAAKNGRKFVESVKDVNQFIVDGTYRKGIIKTKGNNDRKFPPSIAKGVNRPTPGINVGLTSEEINRQLEAAYSPYRKPNMTAADWENMTF